jgi:hypothetical protein
VLRGEIEVLYISNRSIQKPERCIIVQKLFVAIK